MDCAEPWPWPYTCSVTWKRLPFRFVELRSHKKLIKLAGELSAVKGGTWGRIRPISDFWLGFPAQRKQTFSSSGVDELVPDLSGIDKALTYKSAGHPKLLYCPHVQIHPILPQYLVEYMAHTKGIDAVLVAFTIYILKSFYSQYMKRGESALFKKLLKRIIPMWLVLNTNNKIAQETNE